MLGKKTQTMPKPMVQVLIAHFGIDPFIVLISCLLSLRARDTATLPVCMELFEYVRTPEQMIELSLVELERRFYSLGFYRAKASQVKEACHELIERFSGKVPGSMDELLSIKGVGRKTANLVLGHAFGVPSICVDVHVHRISNRLGLVSTKTPEQTEFALQKIIPKEFWIELNTLLVVWGQNVCTPVSPRCSRCPLFDQCIRKGVTSSR